MGLITAIRFLTIIPLPEGKGFKTDMGNSIPYFPIVGLIIGAIYILFNFVFSLILPHNITCILLIIIGVIITGAHHLDGLSDTFDAFAGGKSLQRKFEIMKDVKTGVFGTSSIVLLLLLKYTVLTYCIDLTSCLLIMPSLSRWMMVNSLFFFPSAKNSGMGYTFKRETTLFRYLLSTGFALIICFCLLPWLSSIIVIFTTWLLVLGIAMLLNHSFNGLTGDNLGAINEIAEVIILILIYIITLYIK